MEKRKRHVVVGMSGGIDSAVTAHLLKEEGYHVTGITMKIWDGDTPGESTRSGCYGPGEASDIADAARVADRLGIGHIVIDQRTEYRNTVLDYFEREYRAGRTPNPCIVCNARIKFGTLLDSALAEGIPFDLFATGHYARIDYSQASKRYLLKRGVDERKDQSYFLYRLSQEQLARTLFPLGSLRKDEVKALALAHGWGDLLAKRESQDFLEWDDYGTLLQSRGEPGIIRDQDGRTIGTHRGIAFYTVGQRQGLHLGGMKEPYYVISIDAGKNELLAGPKSLLRRHSLVVADLHWIVPPEEYRSHPIMAKIRSTGVPAACTLPTKTEDGTDTVRFEKPQESITPGQSVVFYAGDVVLGGGIIRSSVGD